MTDIPFEQAIITKLYPALERIHEQHPKDILFVDIPRVDLLFDKDQKLLVPLLDSNNEMWTLENPLPINSTTHQNDIIDIWRTQKESTIQSMYDLMWLLKIQKLYPHQICLVVCQNAIDSEIAGETIRVPTFTIHTIQLLNRKDRGILLSTSPNSVYNWFCKHCAKDKPTKKCTGCFQNTTATDENFSKPGTWYCDAECQKKDWFRHKNECVTIN